MTSKTDKDQLNKINRYLSRKPKNHKGDNGKVLIIGGSSMFAGAVMLASATSLRIGADLVTLVAPSIVCKSMNCYMPDIITIRLSGNTLQEKHFEKIKDNVDKFDVIHIGNGIGDKKSSINLVKKISKLCSNLEKKMVIDADGIKAVRLQDVENAILTPHQKEYERLLRNSGTNDVKKVIGNNVILVKGKRDKIITFGRIYVNKNGNPGMAKAGTGDVLAGLCSGMLAKSGELLKSAKYAAWLSGYIGDKLLEEKKGYYYIASDFIDEIRKLYINKDF